ncbi:MULTISPECIES: alpha/beta hydrolase family protein [Flavobacterium]|uniref:alpha/beta hydrolase family protein n=1 Tax=Flavobacterium TaxID=237 RepID=UPI0011835089|nr:MULTISPECIES: prolyl oligopeptidase family serine peptidase [Flavobacterium]MCR4029793.1 prolyl oligopeptidase family serine peptidase [Flavobacterium panacis]
MKKIVLLCALALSVHSLSAQKKAVDSIAYQSWQRIGTNKISYNGNWALYKTAFQDAEKESKPETFIINTKSGKKLTLEKIGDANFVGTGDILMYQENNVTYLHNLATGNKKVWKTTDYTQTLEGTNYLYFSHFQMGKDGNNSNKLVFFDLAKNDSIVINNIKSSKMLRGQKIIFTQVNDNSIVLKYGDLKGPYKEIYSGSVAAFGDFSINTNELEGTFTTKTDPSKEVDVLHYFNLKTNSQKEVLDFNSIKWEDQNYKFSRNAYPFTENTRFVYLDIRSASNQYPDNRIKKSDIDIWKWNEGAMERRLAKVRGEKASAKDPLYVYDLKEKKCIKISDNHYSNISHPDAVDYSKLFKYVNDKYTIEVDWTFTERNDLYIIDAATGKDQLVKQGIWSTPFWNPAGTFALYFDEKQEAWQSYKTDGSSTEFKNIPTGIPYSLKDQEKDMGRTPVPYGIAGWLNNGNSVALYDKFDIWVIDLNGNTKPYSLTQEFGRKNNVVLRLYGSEFGGNLTGKTLTLRGFDLNTKAEGVYVLKNNKITVLASNPNYDIKIQAFAGNQSNYLFTKESASTFPDLWWANENFKTQKRLTDVNPQQAEYNWMKTKLLRWKNFDGTDGEGSLYVPQNYDASKTYPVIVHFYEKHTHEMNHYPMPELSTSNINIPTFLSRGYLVFMPDVNYTYNSPGNSAYNAVVSGTQYLIDQKISEKGKIGIQGHSFGGYETSYIITKTPIYTCAIVGSGVSNFTSNYLNYRVNGISNMFKYEADQYRMKGSMYEFPKEYVDNSPIFSANKVTTPALIFHNDKDGAVPFDQGMGLFFALRRLGKEAWLVNYKTENHTLDRAVNQKDWTQKMLQYFDFYLKGASRPDWM